MKNFICIFLLFITSTSLYSQSQFQLAIGGTASDEAAYSIIQTADGGYVAVGETNSGFAVTDIYVVKINSCGQLQWSRTLGSPQSYQSNTAFSVVQTKEGGYAVAGMGENRIIYFAKLDFAGTVEWVRRIAEALIDDYAFAMIQTRDEGYAVCTIGSSGIFNYDMYIVKLNGAGMLQWSKNIGGTGSEHASCIIQTRDGGFAISGETTSFGAGDWDMFIVKIDSAGTVQWSKTFGGADADFACSIVQTVDGGYAMAGLIYSNVSAFDMYIVKLDSNGTLLWSETVGGTGNDEALSMVTALDGGFAITGFTTSFGAGLADMYIVKLNAAGTLQWSRSVGGTGEDIAYSIIQTNDGGYAVAGYTGSFGADEMFIVKLDANGNTCGNSTTPSSSVGSGGTLGSPSPTVTSTTPTIITVSPIIGSLDSISTICITGIKPIANEIPDSYKLYQNYPNPFNPITTIKYEIPFDGDVSFVVYDIIGKEVINKSGFMKAGRYEYQFDGSNLSSGVYFYSLKIGSYFETKKMLIIK
jgi:hypothetical protein